MLLLLHEEELDAKERVSLSMVGLLCSIRYYTNVVCLYLPMRKASKFEKEEVESLVEESVDGSNENDGDTPILLL